MTGAENCNYHFTVNHSKHVMLGSFQLKVDSPLPSPKYFQPNCSLKVITATSVPTMRSFSSYRQNLLPVYGRSFQQPAHHRAFIMEISTSHCDSAQLSKTRARSSSHSNQRPAATPQTKYLPPSLLPQALPALCPHQPDQPC